MTSGPNLPTPEPTNPGGHPNDEGVHARTGEYTLISFIVRSSPHEGPTLHLLPRRILVVIRTIPHFYEVGFDNLPARNGGVRMRGICICTEKRKYDGLNP